MIILITIINIIINIIIILDFDNFVLYILMGDN